MLGLSDQRLCDLDPPLLLGLVDAQQGQTHDGDDHGCDQVEDTLPEILGAGPDVAAEAIEDADEGTADTQTDEDAQKRAEPHLADQTLVDFGILVWPA